MNTSNNASEKYVELKMQFARYAEMQAATLESFIEKKSSPRYEIERHKSILNGMLDVCIRHGIADDGSEVGCFRIRATLLPRIARIIHLDIRAMSWYRAIGVKQEGRNSHFTVYCMPEGEVPQSDFFVKYNSPYRILLKRITQEEMMVLKPHELYDFEEADGSGGEKASQPGVK